MNWISKSILLLIYCSFFLSLDNSKAQTLNDYQLEAAQNNPELRAAYYEYRAELLKAPQVSTLPDPEIAFAYFISPIETRVGPQQARLSATQMFPWFGTLGDKESKSLLEAKAKFEVFQEQRNRLFYEMELLWAELYNLKEKIRIARENLDIINTLVNISLRKYETGLVPQVDVLRAQIEQDELKTNIQLLEDNLRIHIKKFNELRNLEDDELPILPDSLNDLSSLVIDEGLWLDKLRNNNPGINRLRFSEEAARSQIQIAENNGKPSFGLGLDYIATGERSDVPELQDNGKDALIARLSVKIPLYRGKYKAQIEEATIRQTVARNRITESENHLETSFYLAQQNLEDAKRRFKLYDEKQIQRVQQTVNILLQSYSSDNSQFEEILRMQRKLFTFELERVKAIKDEFQAFSYLQYLVGEQNITPEEINY